MPTDAARLRSLFSTGLFTLVFPLAGLLDPAHRGMWFGFTILALVGTVASVGFLYRTTSNFRAVAERASEDAVTGLMTADSLVRHVDEQVGPGAIAVFDIDSFDSLNRTIGHQKGDEVLRLVAQRMKDDTRGSDVAARVGADRFALYMAGVKDRNTAATVASRLLEQFFEPAHIGGLELDISASVGAALSGAEGAASTLKNATLALEAAKSGATPLEVFRSEHESHSVDSLAMITQVQLGIEREEFEVYLQPVVDVWNGRAIGVEALVRWNHGEMGAVPPSLFLKQIENLPVGRAFSRYMLERSIQALSALGNRDIGLSVNLSARDVEDLELPLVVSGLLTENGISARRLTVEVPESVGSRRRERTEQVLAQLRDLGCGIAIDDFGGSGVPIDFLASLPVTELKIASSFVSACVDDSTARTVIRHCVGLAHGAGLRATAKGVERQAVLDAVTDLGCDAAQGFHFAHPMPVVIVAKWLENDRVSV